MPKRRKPKAKGRKKPVETRPDSSPKDTDDGNMDQFVQPPQPVPPLRTTWPHAQPEPSNQAPEEDDPELPDELMQAGNVEPNPGPLLHCQKSPRLSWKMVACGDVEPNHGPVIHNSINNMLLLLLT